jgi:hypothetical protein
LLTGVDEVSPLTPSQPKRDRRPAAWIRLPRVLGAAALALLASIPSVPAEFAPSPVSLRSPSSAASVDDLETRLARLFDAHFRVSACATDRFRALEPQRRRIEARIRQLPLRQLSSPLEFVVEYLSAPQTGPEPRPYVGPTCIPSLRALQSEDAWINEIAPYWGSPLPRELPDDLLQSLPLVAENLLEDDRERLRPLTARAKEGILGSLRANFSHVRADTDLRARQRRAVSPEFALLWAARLGDRRAYETARGVAQANIQSARLREDALAYDRRMIGLRVIAAWNTEGDGAATDERRKTMLTLACLPETDYDAQAYIEQSGFAVPSRCRERWLTAPDQSRKR